ncbi:MAG TPA: hypothetical protein VMI53_06315 [Opitutaceae bacterium]|nr:hypothetical protein [Opitutaceae bacterium]
MRKLIAIVLNIFIFSSAFAASATPRELIDKLERAVKIFASGDVDDGYGAMMAEANYSKSPKERAADLDDWRSKFAELRDLGPSHMVNRVSLVFLGDSYFRVRFIDQRENGGALLWTFICEKDKDEWSLNTVNFIGNSDFSEVFKALDAADFSKELPKEPPPNQ